MGDNRTAEQSAKEFRRFMQWSRALTVITALIPLWFLYVAVVTALGMNEVAPLSLSFGNPVGGVVAFGLIGALGLVTFSAQFIGAGRQMRVEAAADVHDERKSEVVQSYRMARLIGMLLIALGLASAAVAAGALLGASYANAFVKPGNVPLGFGFVALMLIFMGDFACSTGRRVGSFSKARTSVHELSTRMRAPSPLST